MNKKIIIIIIILGVIGTGAYFFWRDNNQVEAQVTTEPVVEQPDVVSAEAFVVPLQEANLSFQTGGQVVAIEVKEGDALTQGQLLAQLDDTTQQANLAEAKANLVKAQASLAQAEAALANLKSGATPEQLAQAAAELEKAEIALADLMNGPTDLDIAEAQAKVETARASLVEVQAGTRQEEIDESAANVLSTESEVRLAQADYDEFVYGEPDVAEQYGVALQQATLNYDAAKANYDKLVAGPTEEEVAIYRAQLYEAQVALDKIVAGATREEIAQAQADVKRLQAALAEKEVGATDEEIAESEANVEATKAEILMAETQVASAQAELSKTEIVAPFDSVVGNVDINLGEVVQSGTTSIIVGDTSTWLVETDDLNEIDRAKIRSGAEVTLRVDALPGQTFTGRVLRISPQSELKAGDVTYTATIEITEGNLSALEWGMTVFVDIEISPEL